MFVSNKKDKRVMNESNVPSINMISEGTRIVGNLSTKKDFRISGELEGKLEIEGKCIVSASAVINGDILASDADIAGKVNGEIVVKNRLTLRQNCNISGDIHTKILVVEEGAMFQGACHMSAAPSAKLREEHREAAPLKAVND
jgi:cytoskeletal protein CcmA (bactofilin family)